MATVRQAPSQYVTFDQVRAQIPNFIKERFSLLFQIAAEIPTIRVANKVFSQLLTSEERTLAYKTCSAERLQESYLAQGQTFSPLPNDIEGAIALLSSVQPSSTTKFVPPDSIQEISLYEFCQEALVQLKRWKSLCATLSSQLDSCVKGRTKSLADSMRSKTTLQASPAPREVSNLPTYSYGNSIAPALFAPHADFEQVRKQVTALRTKSLELFQKLATTAEELQVWCATCRDVPPDEGMKTLARRKIEQCTVSCRKTIHDYEAASQQTLTRIDTAIATVSRISPEDRRGIEIDRTAYPVHAYCQHRLLPSLKDWRVLCTSWKERVTLLTHYDTPSLMHSLQELKEIVDPSPSILYTLTTSLPYLLSLVSQSKSSTASATTMRPPVALPELPSWVRSYDSSSTFSLPIALMNEIDIIRSALSMLSSDTIKSESFMRFMDDWEMQKHTYESFTNCLERLLTGTTPPSLVGKHIDWFVERRNQVLDLVGRDMPKRVEQLLAIHSQDVRLYELNRTMVELITQATGTPPSLFRALTICFDASTSDSTPPIWKVLLELHQHMTLIAQPAAAAT